MSDIHALSGAFAVDALDVEERTAFESHMSGCETCRSEVSSLREAASALSALSTLVPSDRLRSSVLGSIGQVRPLPPIATDEPAEPEDDADDDPHRTDGTAARPIDLDQRRASRRGGARVAPRPHRGRWLAAAAAVVLLGGGAVVTTQPWQDEPSQQLSVADQVIGAPDVMSQTATLPDGAVATIYRSVSLGKAVLRTKDLPDPTNGSVYQMWLQDPQGDFVDAGLMPRDSGDDHTVVLRGTAADAIGAGITVEPAGGSKQPTSEPIALFDLKADA